MQSSTSQCCIPIITSGIEANDRAVDLTQLGHYLSRIRFSRKELRFPVAGWYGCPTVIPRFLALTNLDLHHVLYTPERNSFYTSELIAGCFYRSQPTYQVPTVGTES